MEDENRDEDGGEGEKACDVNRISNNTMQCLLGGAERLPVYRLLHVAGTHLVCSRKQSRKSFCLLLQQLKTVAKEQGS